MGPGHHHHPGGPHGDGFGWWWMWPLRRAGGPRAWTAATEAADRLRAVRFAPGERALLEQATALLAPARRTPHSGERLAAYARAGQRLADLERRCGWVLPQQAAAVLRHEARGALAGSPA